MGAISGEEWPDLCGSALQKGEFFFRLTGVSETLLPAGSLNRILWFEHMTRLDACDCLDEEQVIKRP